jgi:hypothetical protein
MVPGPRFVVVAVGAYSRIVKVRVSVRIASGCLPLASRRMRRGNPVAGIAGDPRQAPREVPVRRAVAFLAVSEPRGRPRRRLCVVPVGLRGGRRRHPGVVQRVRSGGCPVAQRAVEAAGRCPGRRRRRRRSDRGIRAGRMAEGANGSVSFIHRRMDVRVPGKPARRVRRARPVAGVAGGPRRSSREVRAGPVAGLAVRKPVRDYG